MRFARIIASPTGRGARVVVGLALVTLGVTLVAQQAIVGGIISVGFGLLLSLTASANLCPLAALFGGPVDGRRACPVN